MHPPLFVNTVMVSGMAPPFILGPRSASTIANFLQFLVGSTSAHMQSGTGHKEVPYHGKLHDANQCILPCLLVQCWCLVWPPLVLGPRSASTTPLKSLVCQVSLIIRIMSRKVLAAICQTLSF